LTTMGVSILLVLILALDSLASARVDTD